MDKEKEKSTPFTVPELKMLDAYEWVWITSGNGRCGSYVMKYKKSNDYAFYATEYSIYPYATYGKTWLAFKNKEEAEKGGFYCWSTSLSDELYD